MKKILETIQNHPKKKLIISLSIGSLSVLVALSLLLVYYFTKPCEHFLDGGTITKEPTCTEAGSKVFLCQLCEYAEYTEIPLIEHNFKSEIVLDATCKDEGEKKFTCTVCAFGKTEPLPIIDEHDFKSEIVLDATCQSEGEEKLTCTVCSIEKTKSIPLKEEHTFEFRIINESTCTQKGLKEQECTVCGIKGIREEIELKNHAYTETIITHASCTTSGQKEFTCTCGNSYTETIPVKEHQWIEATCTTPSTCSVCNAVNGTELGHDIISVNKKPGTYSSNERLCRRCKKYISGLSISYDQSFPIEISNSKAKAIINDVSYTTSRMINGETAVDITVTLTQTWHADGDSACDYLIFQYGVYNQNGLKCTGTTINARKASKVGDTVIAYATFVVYDGEYTIKFLNS
ncbi:MAG: hypothetical protein E7660_05780 [Ruminococcaceae bacterium]|nr:hypothetical protein [Oscillospiraceae bacterium]